MKQKSGENGGFEDQKLNQRHNDENENHYEKLLTDLSCLINHISAHVSSVYLFQLPLTQLN